MPSELQRVARGLVECLDQVPEIVARLQETATRLRQQASWIADLSWGNPYGRQAALLLDDAARRCDEAAYRASLAPPKALVWAQTMVGGTAAASATGRASTGVVTSGRSASGTTVVLDADQAHNRRETARAIAKTVGRQDPKAVAVFEDAYQVAQDFPAPFIVKIADDMLTDLRESVARHPEQRVVFVGRDGRSLAIAVAQLDPAFFRSHCSEVVLSRTLVESAVQDLEQHQGKSFPQIAGFRRTARNVDPADTVGAVHQLTDYLHSHGVPVGVPSSRVTLVDSSYKGTIQELLSAVYPETTFDGRYAFLAESPDDQHPGSKKGYALHLDGTDLNRGIPAQELPDDVSRTFSHQDALATIEEMFHGPLTSPRQLREGTPAQAPLRDETGALNGLNPRRISPRLTDANIREGVMHASLVAIHHYARGIARHRDAGGDYGRILSNGADRYRDQVRAWIKRDAAADPRFTEFMDSFVRRTDKRIVDTLSSLLKQRDLTAEQTTAVWDAYDRYRSDSAKQAFVDEYRNQHESRRPNGHDEAGATTGTVAAGTESQERKHG